MPKKLKNLVIKEGSLVDNAANQLSDIVFFKRDDGGEEEQVIDGLEKSVDDSIEKIGRKISSKRMNRLTGIFEKLKDFLLEAEGSQNKVQKEDVMEVKEMLENEDVVKHFEAIQATALEEVTKSKDELQETVDTLTAKVEDIDKKDKKVDIWKGVDPAVKTEFEAMKKKADESEEIAKQEREIRIAKDYSIEAETFDKVGSKELIAKMLRTADNEGEDGAKELREMLKSSQAKAETITKEIGEDGSDTEDNTEAKLDALAKSYQKEHGGTIEAAHAEVLETPEGIELNKKYNQERSDA